MEIKLIHKKQHTRDKRGTFKTLKGALNFINKRLTGNIVKNGLYIKGESVREFIYLSGGDEEGIKAIEMNITKEER